MESILLEIMGGFTEDSPLCSDVFMNPLVAFVGDTTVGAMLFLF